MSGFSDSHLQSQLHEVWREEGHGPRLASGKSNTLSKTNQSEKQKGTCAASVRFRVQILVPKIKGSKDSKDSTKIFLHLINTFGKVQDAKSAYKKHKIFYIQKLEG
jgi:hypothetical protein